MSEKVWLASYPKSGNTWIRLLIGSLMLEDGHPLDINRIPGDCGIASARSPFDESTLIPSNLLTHEEIDALRPQVNADLPQEPDQPDGAAGVSSVRFVKLHDAYTLSSTGVPLFAGARAAILLVRDPRDVASSYANHNRSTIDRALDLMADPGAVLFGTGRPHDQLPQKLLGWSEHAASWLDQRDVPVHVVRYEDMKRDTVGTLRAAMHFAGWPVDRARTERAAAMVSFEKLREQEASGGFCEWHDPGGRRFFRRGEAGGWRDELTLDQIDRIERAHAPMMQRLGYELSSGVRS
jgi:hypothetical protein